VAPKPVLVVPKPVLVVAVVPNGEPNVFVGFAPNSDVPVVVVEDWPNENGVLGVPNAGLFC